MNKYLQIFIVSLFAVLVDQLSKLLISFYSFEIILNQGISFNLLSSIPNNLITLLMMCLILAIFFIFKKEWLENSLASGLFFGGAVSNILDRIFFGAVKDWLKIPFFGIYNNLADWFIFVGLAMFLIYNRKDSKK